jgi:hypothetical protein
LRLIDGLYEYACMHCHNCLNGRPCQPKVERSEPVAGAVTAKPIRTFDTGATRDVDADKLDYEGFLHPLVLKRYAEYMHEHRRQKDGSLRASDNWTKGIPRSAYRKSLLRHLVDTWLIERGHGNVAVDADIEKALCGVMFNAMGLLHEVLLGRDVEAKS